MAIQLPDRRTLSQVFRTVLDDECACERYKPEQASEFCKRLCSLSEKEYPDAGRLAHDLHGVIAEAHPKDREQWCLLYVLLIRMVREIFESISSRLVLSILEELDDLALKVWPLVPSHARV